MYVQVEVRTIFTFKILTQQSHKSLQQCSTFVQVCFFFAPGPAGRVYY